MEPDLELQFQQLKFTLTYDTELTIPITKQPFSLQSMRFKLD